MIQTYNESALIHDCVQNARDVGDSVIVVDTGSTDDTVSRARAAHATVLSHPFVRYVEPARSFGVTHADGDWVFLLDADEYIPPELAAEIRTVIEAHVHNSYRVPRKELFGRKVWLRHGGWWPNHQIRLIRKEAFRDWPPAIHSTPIIEGSEGVLENPLLHFSKNDYARIVEKTTIFEDTEAELLAKAGRKATVPVFFRKFFGELYRRLIRDHGYLDGKIGVIESIYQAFSKTITYLYVYEKTTGRTV
ncbi:MAG: glycosyltransferase family 2 protein [Patescibacteria group bacterium]|nr:glycosyltransferase family 2 protein [Patescibacteria group bacterium]